MDVGLAINPVVFAWLFRNWYPGTVEEFLAACQAGMKAASEVGYHPPRRGGKR